MTKTLSPSDAIEVFADAFKHGDLAHAVAQSLACYEVEALAGVLRLSADPEARDAAEVWLDMHALDDDEDEAHYERGAAVRKHMNENGGSY